MTSKTITIVLPEQTLATYTFDKRFKAWKDIKLVKFKWPHKHRRKYQKIHNKKFIDTRTNKAYVITRTWYNHAKKIYIARYLDGVFALTYYELRKYYKEKK